MPLIKEDKARVSLDDRRSGISKAISKAKASLQINKAGIVSESTGVNSTGYKQLYDSGLLYDSGITYDDYNGSPVYGERAKITFRSE